MKRDSDGSSDPLDAADHDHDHDHDAAATELGAGAARPSGRRPTPPRPPLLALVVVGVAAAAAAGCGTTPAPPPSPAPSSTDTTPGERTQPAAPPDPRLQPPPFAPAPVASADARRDARTEQRREILDAAWRIVRDKHYDPTLGGLDWQAVRRRFEPLALAAPDDETFYRTLNNMIGELGQSHMVIAGPGAGGEDDEGAPDGGGGAGGARQGQPEPASQPGANDVAGDAATEGGAVGDPGLTVRVIDGHPTITRVRPRSSAERAGLAPGLVVTHIGGRPLDRPPPSPRPLRPIEERFAVRRLALRRLQGAPGTKVTVRYLDRDDRPSEAILARDPPRGPTRQVGHLPPLYPEARVFEIDHVGVIAFNIFLLDPLLGDIQRAIDRFRAARVKGVILDLRGNPGGLGAMAIPVASELVAQPTTLGTLRFREFAQTFVAKPSLGRVPFTGPLVILTDEGTASASEMLAAGLQEAGRARVVGDTTLGAVLPSIVEALPGGAIMQYVVADFRTPKGVLVEGHGVQPDQRVLETRAALRAGHDPVLDAGISAIRTWRPPKAGPAPPVSNPRRR